MRLISQGLLILLSGVCFLTLRVTGNDVFPPPLTKEEEKSCFLRNAHGDEKARDRLIRHNLRLVAHIIKKYYSSHKEQEDLLSIGTIGLIKAIDSFDCEKGARFTTYAGKCVQNEILMYFRSQKKLSSETSINDAIEYDKDGNPLTYLDVVSVEEDLVDQLDLKLKTASALRGISTRLTKRERTIIVLRYGLHGRSCLTQREVAAGLGISRSYVSRLEKSALEKLKEYMLSQKNTP